jgi:hypothetical protein
VNNHPSTLFNTNLVAMNAFCLWLHQEEHAPERVKLSRMRVEKRVLQLLDDTQMRVLIATSRRPSANGGRTSRRSSSSTPAYAFPKR